MPSRSAINFRAGLDRALVLHSIAGHPRLRPQSRKDADTICHATLASATAAWNYYIVNVISDFHEVIANPTDIHFHSVSSAWKLLADNALAKFNTPNSENCRSLLSLYTGYDPLNDWAWPHKGMGGIQVRERLNEILKVRHSFAHGFAIPSYWWTQNARGEVRLTKAAVNMSLTFFRQLVSQTDKGLDQHLLSIYGKCF